MPCRSDDPYDENTDYEYEIRQTMQLLLFVEYILTDHYPPKLLELSVLHPSKEQGDFIVASLCKRLTELGPEKAETLFFSNADKGIKYRKLEEWWAKHQKSENHTK